MLLHARLCVCPSWVRRRPLPFQSRPCVRLHRCPSARDLRRRPPAITAVGCPFLPSSSDSSLGCASDGVPGATVGVLGQGLRSGTGGRLLSSVGPPRLTAVSRFHLSLYPRPTLSRSMILQADRGREKRVEEWTDEGERKAAEYLGEGRGAGTICVRVCYRGCVGFV